MPVHKDLHYCLVGLDTRNFSLQLYDSLLFKDMSVVDVSCHYVSIFIQSKGLCVWMLTAYSFSKKNSVCGQLPEVRVCEAVGPEGEWLD